MKQNEATPERPFFSVSYIYGHNHGTSYSFNRFFEVTGDKTRTTMGGTGDEALAIQCADYLIKQPGIGTAQVHKTTDCYNHKEVYRVDGAS